MRIRNIKNADKLIYDSPYIIENPYQYRGNFQKEVFKNTNPIHLEIGMGKGYGYEKSEYKFYWG